VISDANPAWNAMLRDTISPTMLNAGVRANVIPTEARGTLNIRLLPGDTIDALLGQLSKLVSDSQVKFEIQQNAGLAAPTSSLGKRFLQRHREAAAQSLEARPCCRINPRGERIRRNYGFTMCKLMALCLFH